jgi:hypothetical protein
MQQDPQTSNLKRNKKQFEVLEKILNNTADYEKPGDGTYQRGFTMFLNWGRGTGKTHNIMDMLVLAANMLPRGVTGLWSSTYKSIQSIVLSQSSKVWSSYGYTEFNEKTNPGGCYVINRKPPEWWAKPFLDVKSYDNTISWAKGHLIKLLSADRPDLGRGDNFDVLIGDEVAFTNKDYYQTILKPALRANKGEFSDPRKGREIFNHPMHWLSVLVSSLPRRPAGRWFLQGQKLQELDEDGYFFSKANAIDNRANLPGNYIESQRNELDPITFMIEIMNELPEGLPNGFYPGFDAKVHVGTNYSYQFDDEQKIYVDKDLWYDPWKPLVMGWDFNGYFTCALVKQKLYDYDIFNKEFFAKESTSTLIERVCDDFISYYKHHLKRIVYLRGDRSGKNKDPDRNTTLFQKIKSKLTDGGFVVIDETDNTYPSYQNRYILISDILKENNPRYPKIRVHEELCPSLVVSLQNAGMKDKDTFEKDKSDEGSNNGVAQEYATHLSDAFDYIIYHEYGTLTNTSTTRSSPMRVRKR